MTGVVLIALACSLVLPRLCLYLDMHMEDGWRTRVVIALAIMCAVVATVGSAVQAKAAIETHVIYDLDQYCRIIWWDWFTCGW